MTAEQTRKAALAANEKARARKWEYHAADREFDALHGGRELLPIEQVIYEEEGAERFARHHQIWTAMHGSTQ